MSNYKVDYDAVEDCDTGDIFSKQVRAGRRSYFFDIRSTRSNDLFLTITESRKCVSKEGDVFFEKRKIIIYKEDFEKITDALSESIEYIVENSTTKNDFNSNNQKFRDFIDQNR